MRRRIVHILIVTAGWLLLGSCRKETSVENGVGLTGTFMANIDGVQWIAADSTKGAVILQGLINLTGISVDHKQLSITLDDTVPGVYTLNQSSVSLGAYADNDSSNLFAFATNQGQDTSQAGGVVTVTEIDKVHKTLSGNFSFKVYRDLDNRHKTITQGIFYKLSYESSLPSSGTVDSIYAFIDGDHWAAQSIIASPISPNLAINGSNLDGSQSVSLLIPLNVAPGRYSLDYRGLQYIGQYSPEVGIGLVSTSGLLEILENNTNTHRVRGNFQFLAADPSPSGNLSHQLTGGYFSVQYN